MRLSDTLDGPTTLDFARRPIYSSLSCSLLEMVLFHNQKNNTHVRIMQLSVPDKTSYYTFSSSDELQLFLDTVKSLRQEAVKRQVSSTLHKQLLLCDSVRSSLSLSRHAVTLTSPPPSLLASLIASLIAIAIAVAVGTFHLASHKRGAEVGQGGRDQVGEEAEGEEARHGGGDEG